MSEAVLDRARDQGIWLAAGHGATRLIQFASTIVLARLLVPEDFGTVALAAVVWEVIALFGNTGVAATIIHRRGDVADLCQAGFWLNAAVSTAVAVASLAVAAGAAAFYGDTRVVAIIGCYAGAFLIASAGTIHTVLLTRQVDFGRLVLLDISGAAASAVLSITLALFGLSLWSLVLPAPLVALLRTALAWRLHPWRPQLAPRLGLWRGILGYGRWVLGADLIGYLNLNGDYLIVGKVLGQHALGIYSMAFRVANWPVEAGVWAISRVAFPTLSGLQENRERMARAFEVMLRMVGMLSMPAVAILFAAAPYLIAVLYGTERWGGLSQPIRILLPCVALRALASPASQVLLAVGGARMLFTFGAVVTPVLLGGVWYGARFGVAGVATATSIVLGAASIALTILSSRTAGVSARRASASLVPGLAIGAAALGAGLAAPAALDALAARLAGDPRNAGAWLDAGRLAAALCAGGVAALLAARRYFPEDWLRLTSPFGQGFLANRMRRLRVGLGSALRSRGD